MQPEARFPSRLVEITPLQWAPLRGHYREFPLVPFHISRDRKFRRYPDACVIWVDAHADINTHETTNSGA